MRGFWVIRYAVHLFFLPSFPFSTNAASCMHGEWGGVTVCKISLGVLLVSIGLKFPYSSAGGGVFSEVMVPCSWPGPPAVAYDVMLASYVHSQGRNKHAPNKHRSKPHIDLSRNIA
ncbi:hypothetical protein DFP73DRAFT_538597 [Morchella snyderi]|nr:hypothetical protein DFP73DRAFT_538597 [Morchella snyderi]